MTAGGTILNLGNPPFLIKWLQDNIEEIWATFFVPTSKLNSVTARPLSTLEFICVWHKVYIWNYTKFCIGFKIRKSRCRTTLTLRFGLLKMIFECSIARCDVGLGRAIVQCQKNPLRKPKLSINRAILSAHFSAVKFCIGFFCWIGFFLVLHRLFCNWMLQLLLKIVAKNLNYASLHVCTYKLLIAVLGP